MTDTKNTQTAPAGLPEKKWFTLEEVAARWGCDVKDVVKFAKTGELRLSVETIDLTGVKRIIQPDGSAKVETKPISVTTDDRVEEQDVPIRYQFPRGVFVIPQGTAITAINVGKAVLGYAETGNPGEIYSFDSGFFVLKKNLLVQKEDLDAFEQEYRIGKYAGTMPDLSKSDKLDPRKETSYLQIIRVLLDAANMPEEPYKAAEALQAAAALKGLVLPSKRDTIAEKLKAARNLSD